ncbi:Lipase, partial [Durusdinium trenchii]
EVCIVGCSSCLGSWNVSQAIVLKPLHYPLWKSDEIDVSDVGPPEEACSSSKRLEYKYVIRGPHGVKWEHGKNRWAPIEIGTRLTVHDGCFGHIQPYPFSFQEDELDVPDHSKEAPEGLRPPRGWCIAIVGSSVAEGYNTWRKRGWAWLLGEALHQTYGHRVVNVSQSGANTALTKERLKDAVAHLKPDIIIIALSLGNEGLAHCLPGERRAAQHRFEQGLLDLISMALSMDAMPVLGGVYPNNDYNAETYAMLKETARTMATWDVPIFEWLPVLEDGHGRWKESLYFDHAHPNTEGKTSLNLFGEGAASRSLMLESGRRATLHLTRLCKPHNKRSPQRREQQLALQFSRMAAASQSFSAGAPSAYATRLRTNTWSLLSGRSFLKLLWPRACAQEFMSPEMNAAKTIGSCSSITKG